MISKMMIISGSCTYCFKLILDTAIILGLLILSLVSGSFVCIDSHVCASCSKNSSAVAGSTSFTFIILVHKWMISDLLGLDASL